MDFDAFCASRLQGLNATESLKRSLATTKLIELGRMPTEAADLKFIALLGSWGMSQHVDVLGF